MMNRIGRQKRVCLIHKSASSWSLVYHQRRRRRRRHVVIRGSPRRRTTENGGKRVKQSGKDTSRAPGKSWASIVKKRWPDEGLNAISASADACSGSIGVDASSPLVWQGFADFKISGQPIGEIRDGRGACGSRTGQE